MAQAAGVDRRGFAPTAAGRRLGEGLQERGAALALELRSTARRAVRAVRCIDLRRGRSRPSPILPSARATKKPWSASAASSSSDSPFSSPNSWMLLSPPLLRNCSEPPPETFSGVSTSPREPVAALRRPAASVPDLPVAAVHRRRSRPSRAAARAVAAGRRRSLVLASRLEPPMPESELPQAASSSAARAVRGENCDRPCPHPGHCRRFVVRDAWCQFCSTVDGWLQVDARLG